MQRAVEEVAAAVAHQEAEPKMQHILSHDTGHSEPVSIERLYTCQIQQFEHFI